jgi:hypothetical protein
MPRCSRRLRIWVVRNDRWLANYLWLKKTTQNPSMMRIHPKYSQHHLRSQSHPPSTRRIPNKRRFWVKTADLIVTTYKSLFSSIACSQELIKMSLKWNNYIQLKLSKLSLLLSDVVLSPRLHLIKPKNRLWIFAWTLVNVCGRVVSCIN